MQLRRNRLLIGVYWLIWVIILTGCSLSGVPEVPVAKQWTATINNFSMIPIYPMRENVYVGDIRLTVVPDTLELGQLSYRNIGHLDLRDQLNTYYSGRPSLPKDSALQDGSRDPKRPWPQPFSSGGSIFLKGDGDPGNTNRMRLAALPGVKVATIAQGTLAAQIPVSGVGNIGGAAAARGSRILDISLTGVEEIEAPTDYAVLRAFNEYCERERDKSLSNQTYRFSLGQLIRPSGYDNIGNPQFADETLAVARPQVVVVTRVLYSRAIDYTFKTDQGYSADIAAVLGALGNLQGLSGALQQGTKPEAKTTEPTEDSTTTLARELSELVASLRNTVSSSTAPGITLSTVFVDARGITLRDVFERPMAFAAQTVAFDLDLKGQSKTCYVKAAPARPISPR